MRSSKTGRKISSTASAACHVAPSYLNKMLPIFSSSIFVHKNWFNRALKRSPLTLTAIQSSSLKKNGPIMPLHQTVTRFESVSFSMYVRVNFKCEWRSLQLNIDSEWQIFSETFHDNFICSHSFCQKSVERKSPRILIICQISHELTATSNAISTRWRRKKR